MKQQKSMKTIMLTLLICLISITASAGEPKPIQLALLNPIQLVSEGEAVQGIRLNLFYGKNSSVKGLDIGLVNYTTSGLSKGYQVGLVGLNDADFLGFQNNFVNSVKGNCEGFQWGFVNHAQNMNGFQLGIVNYAGTMKGLQIGLVNVIKQNGQFPIFPFINWSF